MDFGAGERFVQRFHDAHAGRTIESFGRGRVGASGNSYDLLARSVSALPSGSRVLDLACGDGVLLEVISDLRSDLELVGVDLNAAEIAAAKERGIEGARFERARANALPFEDASVDHVVCHMSFMLFDEPSSVVRELARVVRPGGAVFMLVSDGSSPEGARRVFVDLVRAHKVEIPRLGTREARTVEGLRGLFHADFEVSRTESVELNLDGSPEEVWLGLSLMYNFAPLSAEQQAQVRTGFFDAFGEDALVRYRISMLHSGFLRK